jgi:predicted XRE-type DNA-binding protein
MSNDKIDKGSGNVFRDLGFKNAEELSLKVELTRQIAELIRGRGLTQSAAAKILKIDQPQVSRLMAGQPTNFSAERLMSLLTILGRNVDVVVRPKRRSQERGIVRVVEARS